MKNYDMILTEKQQVSALSSGKLNILQGKKYYNMIKVG